MRYNDVFRHHDPDLSGECISGDKCLAWTSNYEHAVFDIQDEIHPATATVWLQTSFTHIGWVRFISKFQLIDGVWKRIEYSEGDIPLVNNNPFEPVEIMASNRKASEFPQNMPEPPSLVDVGDERAFTCKLCGEPDIGFDKLVRYFGCIICQECMDKYYTPKKEVEDEVS